MKALILHWVFLPRYSLYCTTFLSNEDFNHVTVCFTVKHFVYL